MLPLAAASVTGFTPAFAVIYAALGVAVLDGALVGFLAWQAARRAWGRSRPVSLG